MNLTDKKQFILDAWKRIGRETAETLRTNAKDMDGTAIIAEEEYIPEWRKTDYSSAPVGTPVAHGGQVWKLIQPYNATVHTSPPPDLRSQWGLCHTKDPTKAKPFVTPLGTSGVYMKDDCCVDGGKTYKCKNNNTVHAPSAYAAAWTVVK